jgi:hypothetical protein
MARSDAGFRCKRQSLYRADAANSENILSGGYGMNVALGNMHEHFSRTANGHPLFGLGLRHFV